ncbi:MAG: ERF family protein [Desulfamplus sp.]|nr:ERF family protein [Desulfamplus sp.]
MNIYEKLNLVQSQLKAPKGQFNSFGNFKYRSLEDVVEGVKPLLSQHGLSLTLSDTVRLIGDRFYIEATATLVNVEQPDQKIVTTAMARESLDKKGMDSSQITGAASSYARKYCLNGLFSIDDTRDADSNTNHVSDSRSHSHNNHNSTGQVPLQYTGKGASLPVIGNHFQPPPINNYPQAMNSHAQTASHNIADTPPAATSEDDNGSTQDGRLSGKQYKFILSLMGGKSKQDMDQICITSYGRTLQHLSRRDASQLIESLVAK